MLFSEIRKTDEVTYWCRKVRSEGRWRISACPCRYDLQARSCCRGRACLYWAAGDLTRSSIGYHWTRPLAEDCDLAKHSPTLNHLHLSQSINQSINHLMRPWGEGLYNCKCIFMLTEACQTQWEQNWLIDWLTDWLTYLFIYYLLLIYSFIYLSIDWLTDWLIDWFNHSLTNQLINQSINQTISQSIGQSVK